MQARDAAAFLVSRGVLAWAHSPPQTGIMVLDGYQIIVADSSRLREAQALVDEFLAMPKVRVEEGWEDDLEPDLSGLDPALIPPCPACNAALPQFPVVGACAACRSEYDLAALIVERHGPEALEGCYETARPEVMNDTMVEAFDLPCPRCAYLLRGLPVLGACPECGGDYDKRRIIADFQSRGR